MFSLSPQTIASLSKFYEISSSDQLFSLIRSFLQTKEGVKEVFSMDLGIALTLT